MNDSESKYLQSLECSHQENESEFWAEDWAT